MGKFPPLQLRAPRAVPQPSGGTLFRDPGYDDIGGPKGERIEGKWLARVEDVDRERRIAYVTTQGDHPRRFEAPWLTPYCHPGGTFEGFDFVPRRGAFCVVEVIQDLPMIIGFYMPPSKVDGGGADGGVVADHAGFRPKNVVEGDVLIGTDDNNYINLTSDGAVLLHSDALSEILLEPSQGWMRVNCERLDATFNGGIIKWDEVGPARFTTYSQLWRDTAISADPVPLDNQVQLVIGKGADIYELKVMRRVGPALMDTYTVHVDTLGNITIGTMGNALVTVDMNAVVTVFGMAVVNVIGTATVASQESIMVAAPLVTVGASEDIMLAAKNILAIGSESITMMAPDITINV